MQDLIRLPNSTVFEKDEFEKLVKESRSSGRHYLLESKFEKKHWKYIKFTEKNFSECLVNLFTKNLLLQASS